MWVVRMSGMVACCILCMWTANSAANDQDPATAAPEVQHVTLLHTSDLHGSALPFDDLQQKPAAGSLAQVSSLVGRLRTELDHPVLVLDSGDTIQGSPLEELANVRWKRMSPTIEAMNLIGYQAMAVGNHEYNFGLEVLERSRSQARFPFLSANTIDDTTGKPAFTPYVVLEAGKVRVGVLGLTTPNVPTWEQPANYRGLSFEAMNETAARWIDTLRDKEACDLVVVLAHTGFERDPDTAEPNGTDDENFAWRLARIPGIDVLLTGHTHMRMPPRRLGQVLVSQPASRAQVVTRIDLDLVHEPTGWTISSWQGSNLSTANEVPDPRVMELLEPIHTEVVAALDVEVGEVTGPVSVAGCRLHDCTALDLVHAVQLEASGAQLSLAAILSDHTPDLIPGGVTRRWVTGLYVYPNVLVSLRLSGAQVRDVLEHAALYYQGLECEAGAACDLIVNPLVRRYNVDTMAGVTYRIDPNQPEGSKVRDLRYQGQPIDPEASFVVVTNNYRATGGGGYPHLRDAEVVWTSPVEVKQQIETYLGAHQPWTPLVDGNWSIGPEVELAADAGRGRWATRDSSSSGVAPIRAVPN